MVVFVFILKTFIPLKESDIYLVDECITFNLALGNKICSFIALTDLPVRLEIILQHIQIIVKLARFFFTKKSILTRTCWRFLLQSKSVI